ncbi:sigma-54-dependent transcriptional regulator [Vibrio hepatarius]|uniref:sigma-54-dependent transcriptional regulator n=1 Tax=Vibrio hepatarius TaxID=171383 RepID=UPI00142D6960|nr:sigma-54 dependent transcriptional regulator [Vibrio hepatarius]NIY84746.1 sigma-54-dependent Fis family transcriptional regulator [Vibrio hepatarius]NVJ57821.1 sigma-54-dependent Fis family transcriptional regulator [Vibrionaceae bacterium]
MEEINHTRDSEHHTRTERPVVLLVDDERLSLQALKRNLKDEFAIITAESVEEAEQVLVEMPVQVVLADQRMPDTSGSEFLTRVREKWPDVVRLMISAYTDPSDLIQSINEAGIYQFIPKPWQPEQLLLSVRNACWLYALEKENSLLNLELRRSLDSAHKVTREKRQKLKRHHSFEQIVCAPDSPMMAIFDQVEQVAPFDIPVLITGESGTGKELITRCLHYASHRSDRPFLTENCGAMPVQLLESELFGHTKGAFTGAASERTGLLEQANGGSVLLDEIGDTSLEFQVKLLRFLQEGELRPLGSNRSRHVNVRVISATNRNLKKDVKEGRFREDLYYRLAAMPIHIPPLRDRPMDIAVIADAVLRRTMKTYKKSVKGFTEQAIECMTEYHWPGNVRELENEVRRTLVLAKTDYLDADLLSPHVVQGDRNIESDEQPSVGMEGSLKDRVEMLEAKILRETLIRLKWNKSQAALELGLSRVGLRAKLERYGLEPNKLSS